MTNQDQTAATPADHSDEFPDANSGLDAVDLDQAGAPGSGAPGASAPDASDAAEKPGNPGEAGTPTAAAEHLTQAADQAETTEPAANVDSATNADQANQVDPANEAAAQVADLTNDLQRINAEYANYRKRTEQQRQIIGEVAVAGVVNELLPILDDLDRAQEHGDYDGVVKSIGDSLQNTLTKLGLTKFGEQGEEFDPAVHEALMTVAAGEGQESQVVGQVLRAGYKIDDRVIRTAGVAVTQ